MQDFDINPCSACSIRHPKYDINNLNDCCFQTCAQFVEGDQQTIINSECGQKCIQCVTEGVHCKGKTRCGLDPEIPSIRLAPQNFKRCLEKGYSTKQALGCCLNKCDDFECQERCIDSYNSTVNVPKESFIFEHKIDRCFFFLVFILIVEFLEKRRILIIDNLYLKSAIYIIMFVVFRYIL